jgi:hypothetical protein
MSFEVGSLFIFTSRTSKFCDIYKGIPSTLQRVDHKNRRIVKQNSPKRVGIVNRIEEIIRRYADQKTNKKQKRTGFDWS